jgi:hypothetical protein
MLLFIGILNAWDLTLWIISNRETANEPTIDRQRRLP